MTTWDWSSEWKREFSHQIAEEAIASDTPPSKWISSGRRSREWPFGENRDFWNRNGPVWSESWARFREAQSNWELWETPDGKTGIELPLEFMAGGVKVKAIPDRVYKTPDGSLDLVDLKFGARLPDAGFQLAFYRLALDIVYGIPGESIRGFYFMNRRGELVPDYSPVKYNRQRLEDVFATAMATIQGGNFLPNPGSQCARCPVAPKCAIVGGEL